MFESKLPFTLYRNYNQQHISSCTKFSDCLSVFYLRQGNALVTVGQQTYALESDQCIFIMPGVSFHNDQPDPERPMFFDILTIDRNSINTNRDSASSAFWSMLSTHSSSLSFVPSANEIEHETILRLLSEAIALIDSMPVHYEIGAMAYIELILFKLISVAELAENQKVSFPLVSNAVTYIENNYMNHISIDTLAKLCCMSKYHFIRNFFSETQQTPVEYINSFRITTACRLLKSQPEEKVINIALSVGFNDLSNFNRTFKRIIGYTPVEYRKNAQRQKQETASAIYYQERADYVPFYSFML